MDITTVVKDLIIPAPEDVKDGTYTPTQLLAKSRADQEAAASAAEAYRLIEVRQLTPQP